MNRTSSHQLRHVAVPSNRGGRGRWAASGRQEPRRGYLYVSVLMTASIVAVAGLTAISVAHLELRTAEQSNDWAEARSLARAAVEDGTLKLSLNDMWRSEYSNDQEYPETPMTLGRGEFSWKLVDPDGDLADDDSDAVELIGIGRVGKSVVAESVKLYPTGQPLSCLEASFHCGGNITAGWTVNITTNQFVSSNGNITATQTGSSITGSAQAVGSIGGTVTGTSTTGISPRRMPGSSVADYYLSNGTWIAISQLPTLLGTRSLTKVVLSPASNPYGGVNPEGIYVIDCQGQRLAISQLRVVGTIVLLNPGSGSSVSGSVRWDPAVTNYPALIVMGGIDLRYSEAVLDEVTQLTNFNPTGTPYEGAVDSDILDNYPSSINGLVYVSGDVNLPADAQNSALRGVLVAATSRCNSDINLTYRSTYHNHPPPGFASGNPMKIAPGSWRRTAVAP
ncbi:MAG: hypothetical protein R3B90_20675 [Planctomycetaceae bacterium]